MTTAYDQALLDAADTHAMQGKAPCSECSAYSRLRAHPLEERGVCEDCHAEICVDLDERAAASRLESIAEMEAENDNAHARTPSRLDRILKTFIW
jgi:hypothetical protein